MGRIDPRIYDGVKDAEYILERVMNRTRWGAGVRDDLAKCLVEIAHCRSLPAIPKKRKPKLRNQGEKAW